MSTVMPPGSLHPVRPPEARALVPAAPAVLLKAYRLIRDPDTPLEDVADTIRIDPGLVVDVLRRTGRTSIPRAVEELGRETVRELIEAQLDTQVENVRAVAPLNRARFWRRSITRAMIATHLARAKGGDAADHAWVAGLLADVGVVLLTRCAHEQYSRVAERYGSMGARTWLAFERGLSPAGHDEFGAIRLRMWGVSAAVCQAVQHHHDRVRDIPDGPGHGLAIVVGAADRIDDAIWSQDTEQAASSIHNTLRALKVDVANVAVDLVQIGASLRALSEDLQLSGKAFLRVERAGSALGARVHRSGLSRRLTLNPGQ